MAMQQGGTFGFEQIFKSCFFLANLVRPATSVYFVPVCNFKLEEGFHFLSSDPGGPAGAVGVPYCDTSWIG